MSKCYVISQENDIIKVKFVSAPSYDDIVEMITEITSKHPTDFRLYDLRDVDFDFSFKEIVNLSEFGKTQSAVPGKVGILVTKDLVFGEMRQFAAYREDDVTSIKVFRSQQEALDWFNE